MFKEVESNEKIFKRVVLRTIPSFSSFCNSSKKFKCPYEVLTAFILFVEFYQFFKIFNLEPRDMLAGHSFLNIKNMYILDKTHTEGLKF